MSMEALDHEFRSLELLLDGGNKLRGRERCGKSGRSCRVRYHLVLDCGALVLEIGAGQFMRRDVIVPAAAAADACGSSRGRRCSSRGRRHGCSLALLEKFDPTLKNCDSRGKTSLHLSRMDMHRIKLRVEASACLHDECTDSFKETFLLLRNEMCRSATTTAA